MRSAGARWWLCARTHARSLTMSMFLKRFFFFFPLSVYTELRGGVTIWDGGSGGGCSMPNGPRFVARFILLASAAAAAASSGVISLLLVWRPRSRVVESDS